MAASSRGSDVLEAFLAAGDESAAEAALSTLLCTHATPLIRRVLGPKMRGAGEDVEDLVQGVLLRLVARLRAARTGASGGHQRIEEFDCYVATVAHRVHSEDLRGRHPLHHRLRRRLREALGRDTRFDVWEDRRGQWLCGLAEASDASGRGRAVPAALADLERVLATATTGPARCFFTEQLANLHAALSTLGRPVRLDVIVSALRDSHGGEALAPPEAARIAAVASPEAQVVDRLCLRRLWEEIRLLPAAQRKALLLNLSDPQRRDLIALFPLTGTASMRDIAAALEMPPDHLAALWERLPLDDHAIGERLGLSRQQVLNLRTAARRRLARRWHGGQ